MHRAVKNDNLYNNVGLMLRRSRIGLPVGVGQLSIRYGCAGTLTSRVIARLHVCRPVDTVTDWQQKFLCSRTTAMEQPTD